MGSKNAAGSSPAGAFVFLMVVLGALLSACSYAARPYNMVAYQRDVVAAHPDTPYRHALAVVHIDGGEKSYPGLGSRIEGEGFRKALESSLGLSRLLADPASSARFDLYANLAEINRPFGLLEADVTSRIEYRVVERATNQVWFSDTVVNTYAARSNAFCLVLYFDPSCDGIYRTRVANEGAIRENIKTFIERLLTQAPLLVPMPSRTSG